MPNSLILEQTQEYVKSLLQDDCTGHDWWHVARVLKLATYIAEQEKADVFVVQLAALLHDIADWKFDVNQDESTGPQKAKEWLSKLDVPPSITEQVCNIIMTMSFKGAGVSSSMSTLEGQVVQDADRLDALGAIGIARTFAYGGHKSRSIYDPEIQPKLHNTFQEYKAAKGTTINHFYEKLLLLKDRMNTSTAKRLAQERHQFMEEFLQQFFLEWEGINTVSTVT